MIDGAALLLSLLSLVPGVAAIALVAGAAFSVRAPLRPAFDPVTAFRFLAAGCQGLTIVLTWQLWQARRYPPLLPIGGWRVPQFDVGIVLLAPLLLCLIAPRPGAVLHIGVLAYAILADQTRLQPEVVSLALLLLATTLPRAGTFLARTHLVTLWVWSGINKFLSLGFVAGSARWIFDGLPVQVGVLRPRFGWLVAGFEMAVGLTLLVPRARRIGVAMAFLLHGMILYVLSPWGHDWNRSVWPWNLALPLAALAFFWPAQERGQQPAQRTKVLIGVAGLLLPLGFYFGAVDTYLAHNLYSDNTAAAHCLPVKRCRGASFDDTWKALQVPLPPEPRLFKQYFASGCQAGDRLVISPRRVRLLFGWHARTELYDCPTPRRAGSSGDRSPQRTRSVL